MSNKYKVIAGILLIAIALVIYMESGKKDPISWYPSYSKSDKIPYGTFVLYETLKENRASEKFKEIRQAPYEFLADSSEQTGTYFFVNDYIGFDKVESEKILSWVAQGNTMFIASSGISETILDTLGMEVEFFYDYNNFEHKPLLNLVNPLLERERPYYLDIETSSAYFTDVDTINTNVLGEFSFSKEQDTINIIEPEVHFVEQAFGEGRIIIHLMPSTFSNYFMLREDNYTYTQNALSYIDNDDTIFWDNHYKNGKVVYTSPMYIFLDNRYLRWAYYMLIIGTLIWVIFEGRRKQRAIPIVKPLPNQTLAFTKTIAGMYLDKRDHKSIATHQINHFMDFIRSSYKLSTTTINDDFISRLASKSSNSTEDTKLLINYIVSLRNKQMVSQDELMQLNLKIEDFKKTLK